MKIGDRIRILRKINKITINELASILGISAPTLRKLENNQGFINIDIVKKIAKIPTFEIKEEELLEYYYNQSQLLDKEVMVQIKGEKVYIIIPKDLAVAFKLEENNEIYCCYLENKLILQHQINDDYIFEKKKIIKDRYSFIFFIGQKLKYLQGRKVKLKLDLKKEVLNILIKKS